MPEALLVARAGNTPVNVPERVRNRGVKLGVKADGKQTWSEDIV